METTYWHRQETKEPLFPEIEFSRPETKRRGGRLLIIGGNQQAFRRVAESYSVARENKVGEIKVAVPDALESLISQLTEDGVYLKSNASGGLGLAAETNLLSHAEWADGVILAGDIGRNSETPQVLDKFITSYSNLLVATADAADVLKFSYKTLMNRPNTLLVISLAQLQKLFQETKQTTAITSQMGAMSLAKALHEFTMINPIGITTFYEGKLYSALDRQVCSTPYNWSPDDSSWRVPIATKQAAFLMQHPETPFKALTHTHLPPE